MDAAETFAESDVTTTTNQTRIENEGIGLVDEGSSVSWGSDGTTGSGIISNAGVVITPNEDLGGVEVTLSGGSSVDTLRLVEVSSGSTLVEASGSIAIGSTHRLTAQLTSGVDYAVEIGSGEDLAYADSAHIGTSQQVDITDGWASGRDDRGFTFTTVTAILDDVSGSATVSWPMPDDLAGWDIAPVNIIEDGGTIDVYAVDADTGDELAGPLEDPGDISEISRQTNVALRVDVSRSSWDQNPRVEALYRRYKV